MHTDSPIPRVELEPGRSANYGAGVLRILAASGDTSASIANTSILRGKSDEPIEIPLYLRLAICKELKETIDGWEWHDKATQKKDALNLIRWNYQERDAYVITIPKRLEEAITDTLEFLRENRGKMNEEAAYERMVKIYGERCGKYSLQGAPSMK